VFDTHVFLFPLILNRVYGQSEDRENCGIKRSVVLLFVFQSKSKKWAFVAFNTLSSL